MYASTDARLCTRDCRVPCDRVPRRYCCSLYRGRGYSSDLSLTVRVESPREVAAQQPQPTLSQYQHARTQQHFYFSIEHSALYIDIKI